jgi:hypothetical protein
VTLQGEVTNCLIAWLNKVRLRKVGTRHFVSLLTSSWHSARLTDRFGKTGDRSTSAKLRVRFLAHMDERSHSFRT